MDPTDYVLLVLAVGGGVTSLSFRVGHALARRRQRTVYERLSCPRTGGTVECRLVLDDAAGSVVKAERCSQCGDRRPDCDQECVRLMNLGMPLRPGDDAAR